MPIFPRLQIMAVLVALVAMSIGVMVWLNGERQAAENRSRAAGAAVERANTITLESDRAHDVERRVTERTFTNVERIQNAPGANDLLPGDVRAAWANGLRDNATIAGDASSKPDGSVR